MQMPASQPTVAFDPAAIGSFRFLSRDVDPSGTVTLRYALGEDLEFAERIVLPVPPGFDGDPGGALDGLLSLLHWVAGVSYYKAALPPEIGYGPGPEPGPAAVALLEALYSEGLGELAYVNRLPELPRPRFGRTQAPAGRPVAAAGDAVPPRRVLVPVGGGKDSAVAIEAVRRSGLETVLFSIGDAAPIARTAEVAGLPRLIARRELDPLLFELNAAGAINGHVPVTAIVTCVAMLTAAIHGLDTVAMANERSASAGNLRFDGVEVNHQYSKGLAAERLLGAAVDEAGAPVRQLSVLRPASELAIARAFAALPQYHRAFTSCNAIFRIDPALRASSWCRDCPKCRFVYLAMAPFTEPAHLAEIFGADLLADEAQYEGFALLAASGGHKPFECVGEEQESIAAIRLLAADERWRDHAVVRRLAAEVLPSRPAAEGDPQRVLALSDEHDVPEVLMDGVRAVLAA
ncbi:MAG TPA: hypothetical protein VN618_12945 [Solirubrobacteraceae bacterium]|nr:hypothetical protein [Solirubrobacteraceae bacterium]